MFLRLIERYLFSEFIFGAYLTVILFKLVANQKRSDFTIEFQGFCFLSQTSLDLLILLLFLF